MIEVLYFKGGAVCPRLIIEQFDKQSFINHFLPQLRGVEAENKKRLSKVYDECVRLSGQAEKGDNWSGNTQRTGKKRRKTG